MNKSFTAPRRITPFVMNNTSTSIFSSVITRSKQPDTCHNGRRSLPVRCKPMATGAASQLQTVHVPSYTNHFSVSHLTLAEPSMLFINTFTLYTKHINSILFHIEMKSKSLIWGGTTNVPMPDSPPAEGQSTLQLTLPHYCGPLAKFLFSFSVLSLLYRLSTPKESDTSDILLQLGVET